MRIEVVIITTFLLFFILCPTTYGTQLSEVPPKIQGILWAELMELHEKGAIQIQENSVSVKTPQTVPSIRVLININKSYDILNDSSVKESIFNDIRNLGGYNISVYSYVNAIGVNVPADAIDELSKLNWVESILDADAKIFVATLDRSVSDINADRLHLIKLSSGNLTGRGVRIAVLDTGIDHDTNLITIARDAQGRLIQYSALDGSTTNASTEDHNGHGTHVAGIIAAHRHLYNGRWIEGVAPEAEIVPVKVLDDQGRGTVEDIVEGINWAISQNVDIIHMSLGTDLPENYPGYWVDLIFGTDYLDEMAAVRNAWDRGIVVVVSAGNEADNHASGQLHAGESRSIHFIPHDDITIYFYTQTREGNYTLRVRDPMGNIVSIHRYINENDWLVNFSVIIPQNLRGLQWTLEIVRNSNEGNGRFDIIIAEPADIVESDRDPYHTITIPGNVEKVITVGAVDDLGNIADFSSRGPLKDGKFKPDVVAPGVSILSLAPIPEYPEGHRWRDGTSMAAPHVSGVAALLIQQYRELYGRDPTPAEIKAIIMNAGVDQNGNVKTTKDNTYGAGKVDAYRAYLSFVFEGSYNFLDPWNNGIDSVDVQTPSLVSSYLPVKGTLYWEDWDDTFELVLNGANGNRYDTTAIASTNAEANRRYTFEIHPQSFILQSWYLATFYPPADQQLEGRHVWGFTQTIQSFVDDKIKAVYAIPVGLGSNNPQHGAIRVLAYLQDQESAELNLYDPQGLKVSSSNLTDVRIVQVFSNSAPKVGGWKLEIKSNSLSQTLSLMSNYPLASLPTYIEIKPINMFAGSNSFPSQITFDVEIYDGSEPFNFAPYNPSTNELIKYFDVKIGGRTASVLSVSGIGNKYTLTVMPPTQPANGYYNLSVNFTFEKFGVSSSAYAVLENAVQYGGAISATNVDVALVIDSSGSMIDNDPNDLRKDAAKFFVDQLQIGDRVAVIDFDEDVVVWLPLTEIRSQADKDAIKAAIDNIDSSGATNIGGGLLEGYNQLQASVGTNRKAAILLTDGYHNIGTHPNDVVPLYKDKGWPIYTIALTGDADEALLKNIASETGGIYKKAEKPEDLLEIYNDLKRVIKKQTIVQKITGKISQSQSIMQSVSIDTSVDSFDVSLSWPGSDLDLILYYPNGSEVIRNASSPTGTNDPNINYISTSTYEIYTVNNPMPGNWSYEIRAVNVSGNESFTATVAASTTLTLSASTDKAVYYLSEPVIITAVLTNATGGIENGNVTAGITSPSGSSETLQLLDYGSGVYRVIYTNTSDTGIYHVRVVANISGITRIAEVEFEVNTLPAGINVTPTSLDFGGAYPGDTKSLVLTIKDANSSSSTTLASPALQSFIRELESTGKFRISGTEITLKSISALQARQSVAVTGVITVGDFISRGGMKINASSVMVSQPVISIPSGGSVNITITLNIPYTVEEGNYTSTIQIITNRGNVLVPANITISKLNRTVVVSQIEGDLEKIFTATTQAERFYYADRIADRLVYWKYSGGG